MYRGGWIAEIVSVRPNSTPLVHFMEASKRDQKMIRLEHNLHKHKKNSEFVGTVIKKERLNRLRDAWDHLRQEANHVEQTLSGSDVLLLDTPTSRELKKIKNKRQIEILDVFVTFEHEESRERCVQDYTAFLRADQNFSRLFGCCVRWRPSHTAMPDKLKLKCGSGGGREVVKVEKVDIEPDDFIWEQASSGYSTWIVSRILTLLTIMLALTMIHVSLISIASSLNSLDSTVRLELCPDFLGPYYDRDNSTLVAFPQRGTSKQDTLCREGRLDLENTDDVFFLSTNNEDGDIPTLNFTVQVWNSESRTFVYVFFFVC